MPSAIGATNGPGWPGEPARPAVRHRGSPTSLPGEERRGGPSRAGRACREGARPSGHEGVGGSKAGPLPRRPGRSLAASLARRSSHRREHRLPLPRCRHRRRRPLAPFAPKEGRVSESTPTLFLRPASTKPEIDGYELYDESGTFVRRHSLAKALRAWVAENKPDHQVRYVDGPHVFLAPPFVATAAAPKKSKPTKRRRKS